MFLSAENLILFVLFIGLTAIIFTGDYPPSGRKALTALVLIAMLWGFVVL